MAMEARPMPADEGRLLAKLASESRGPPNRDP